MKSTEFLLVFKRDHKAAELQLTAATLQRHIRYWNEWITNLAVNDQLASQHRSWDTGGRVSSLDRSMVEAPFGEDKGPITSLISIYAYDYQEAKEIARGCPILDIGGTVEIRMAV